MTAVVGTGALYDEAVKLCLLMLPHSGPEVRDAFAAVLGCLAAACQTSEALMRVCHTCRKACHASCCQLVMPICFSRTSQGQQNRSQTNKPRSNAIVRHSTITEMTE